MSEPLLGEIRMFSGNFAPNGWAFCAGQLLSIGANQALFAIMGTTYGGDGQNTFALPDLRGRVPLGTGGGPGLSDRLLGETGGTEAHTLTVSEMPAHGHTANAAAIPGGTNDPAGASPAIAESAHPYSASAPNVPMAAGTVGDAGGGQPHNNMQPYLGISFIIALQGIFPSQGKSAG